MQGHKNHHQVCGGNKAIPIASIIHIENNQIKDMFGTEIHITDLIL